MCDTKLVVELQPRNAYVRRCTALESVGSNFKLEIFFPRRVKHLTKYFASKLQKILTEKKLPKTAAHFLRTVEFQLRIAQTSFRNTHIFAFKDNTASNINLHVFRRVSS